MMRTTTMSLICAILSGGICAATPDRAEGAARALFQDPDVSLAVAFTAQLCKYALNTGRPAPPTGWTRTPEGALAWTRASRSIVLTYDRSGPERRCRAQMQLPDFAGVSVRSQFQMFVQDETYADVRHGGLGPDLLSGRSPGDGTVLTLTNPSGSTYVLDMVRRVPG